MFITLNNHFAVFYLLRLFFRVSKMRVIENLKWEKYRWFLFPNQYDKIRIQIFSYTHCGV